MKTVMVSGAIANRCLKGGAAWTRLSWVLGLKRLGFRVFFVEQISRLGCVDATGAVAPFENSMNLAYFKQVTEQFGLSGSAALVYEGGDQVHGMSWGELVELAGAADLLVNISGHLRLEPLRSRPRRKAYIDQDPGFTQIWHAAGNDGARLDGHDCYFTVGENVGTSACSVPNGGIPWRPLPQPVVLDEWPVCTKGTPDRFTTVASWRGPYGPIQQGECMLGLKVHEYRKFVELPARSRKTFEAALEIHPADAKDLDLLRRNGWQVVDPRAMTPNPAAFRHYVQTSGAEFSVAQGVYVQTGSGWFSDRTVRYLASGKPALVQDTGFSRNYPIGEGLLAFRTLDEAVAGADEIVRNYEQHCRSARQLAETYFDSDKVLGRFIDEVNVVP